MLVDINNYSAEMRMMILTRLLGSVQSRFYTVFNPEKFTEMAGRVPFISKKNSVGNARDVKIAFGADPTEADGTINSVKIGYDGVFARSAKLTKKQVDAWGNLSNPDALVERLLTICLTDIAVGMDLEGATILKSTTLNEEVAATDVWTDQVNSKPITDLEAAVDKVGNPDLGWIGLDNLRLLQSHEAFRERASNWKGNDGRMPLALALDTLREITNIPTWIVDNTFYDENNAGQVVNEARLFDGVMWMGYSSHMVTAEDPGQLDSDVEYHRKRGVYEGWARRCVTAARADKSAAAIITGTK